MTIKWVVPESVVVLQGKLNLSIDNPFYGKWNTFVNIIAKAFKLSEKERIAFYKSKIARLVAAMPFLAGCEDPERTTIAHLGIYMLIIRTDEYLLSQPGEHRKILQRVRMISNHLGGERRLINRGMNLLILSILSDFEREASLQPEEDIEPHTSAWYLKEEKTELIHKIRECDAPYMDEIITLEEAQANWWC